MISSRFNIKVVFASMVLVLLYVHLPAQVVVRLHNDTTCTPDTVHVGVSAGNISNVASFDLLFTFDESVLRFDSIAWAIPFLDGYMNSSFIAPNKVRLTWDSAVLLQVNNEAVLFRLQFSAIGTGSAPLVWDVAGSSFTDNQGEQPEKDMYDAAVKVSQKAINYTLTQIMEGCRKDEKGRYAISISSGTPPYKIDWHGGFLNPGIDTVVIGLRGGIHNLTLVDGNGCRYDTTYSVKVKPAPRIRIYTEEEHPYVILQKPDVQFFSNIDSINQTDNSVPSWQWNFGEPDSSRSTLTNPLHTFKTAFSVLENGGTQYTVTLWAISVNGCDTTVYKDVQIEKPKPNVYNVFTPNGDGKNELFTIRGSENPELEEWVLTQFYDRMELVVYDRNGRKVFESNDYQNDWDGGGHADGTYYYVLKCYGRFGEETYQGAVMILTGQ